MLTMWTVFTHGARIGARGWTAGASAAGTTSSMIARTIDIIHRTTRDAEGHHSLTVLSRCGWPGSGISRGRRIARAAAAASQSVILGAQICYTDTYI